MDGMTAKGKTRESVSALIIHVLNIVILEIRIQNVSPIKALFLRVLRVLILSLKGFLKRDDQKTASVLTYYSILNVVPIVGVAFAIAKGFGLEKLIQAEILQIAQKANWGSDITTQILSFSRSALDQAKGGVIAGVGVIILFWTVISIFGKIEASLNTIWDVKRPRTLARKFTDYLTMMILAPILLIISSSVTVLVGSQVKAVVTKIAFLGPLGTFILLILNLLPYASMWLLLTILYAVMPNTRIPFRSALAGGIVAGTLFQIIQWIYIRFQIGVAGYNAIYGSLAALPLFLAWVQISWMVVLFGAEAAHATSHYETYGFHPDYVRLSGASIKILFVRIVHLLIRRFSQGSPALSADQIAHNLEIPAVLVRELLSRMIDVGLVVETVGGRSNRTTYQPARSIDDLTIHAVLDAFENEGHLEVPAQPSEEAQKILRSLNEISESVRNSPANLRLKEI